MKKIVPALLMAALLLTGCASTPDPTETTETAETQATAPVVKPTLFEKQADLDIYRIPDGSCVEILPWGEDRFLLLTTTGQLYLLSGQELTVESTLDLGCALSADDPNVTLMGDQISYFNSTRDACVTLGKNLTEIAAVSIRDEAVGNPRISPDFTTIYYCTANSVRALDIATGNSRLLRQEHAQIQSLEGLLFDGTILHYIRQTESGRESCFISTADGTLAGSTGLEIDLSTWEDSFAAAVHMDLPMYDGAQILTGTRNGDSQALGIMNRWETMLFPGEAAVLFYQTQVDGALALDLYDLSADTRIAYTAGEVTGTVSHARKIGSSVWLWSGEDDLLYRWDTAACSETSGTTSYTQRYTLSTPDQTGLEEADAMAQEMSERYGIAIRLSEGANRTAGVDYSGYPDYRPKQYQAALELLDETMARFPEGFFGKLEGLVIELVDDFDPDRGVQPGTGALNIGEERVVQVSVCPDLPAIFFHELFHAMELTIQNQTNALSGWEDRNPRDFSYSGSYAAYEKGELTNDAYPEHFIDSYCLISAREDRAQIFMYAMMEENAEIFSAEGIADKLALQCEAIRQTYGYEDDETTLLPWEQYRNPA